MYVKKRYVVGNVQIKILCIPLFHNYDKKMDDDSRNMSIAAYVLPIGWLYAFFASQMCGLRNPFTVFHLRQGFGVNLILVFVWVLFKFVDLWILEQVVWVVMVLSVIYGVLGAKDGKRIYQLFLGKKFDEWFTFVN